MNSTTNHLKALTKKNFILWKRNPCCSICEILLPTLLCCVLFIMRNNIKRNDIPEMGFLTNYQTLYQFNFFNSTFNPYIKRCQGNSYDEQPSFRNGHVALAPNNPLTQSILQSLLKFNYNIKIYQSKQEIIDYTKSEYYNEDICFGITIDYQDSGQYKYTLLFNTTQYKDNVPPEVPDTQMDEEISYKIENNETFLMPWIKYGFITVQSIIDNLIIRQETGNQNIVVVTNLASQKLPEHVVDNMLTFLKGKLSLFIVLPLILPFLRLTYGLLIEKEKKIREGMKIMGMRNSAFYISWIIYYALIFTILSLLIAAILKFSIFKNSDYSLLFVIYWIFCWSLIFQGIFITSFFTRAKIGNIIAMIWFLLNYNIFDLMQNQSITFDTKVAVSISSHTGLSFAADVFLLIETESKGISWSTLDRIINNYSIASFLGMTLTNILIFLILSIYLDQVIPNEFGKKKHPLYFLNCLFKKKDNQQQIIAQDEENNNINHQDQYQKNMELVDHQLLEQEKSSRILQIKNLTKVYSNGKMAVKDISLTMYNGQIFALLGHNGAGKTTTISMLTGMIEFTQGEAVAFGKNVKSEMDDIRTFMGVCPQHDILFDDLTVREHLELFAVFKGMESNQIRSAVDKAIQDVDLIQKADDLAKNLSGGQKRRLSVAIAFIGDSKLIYLDEPTSGMDTSARRHIWEMLKKYKNDRVIVLTTHFMDEADFLGDRIGIMGEGELICCGSSVFLKNTFGVGYNLTIVKKDINQDSQPIIDLVKQFIPSTNILSNVSAELAMQLPMDNLKDFSILFQEIDQNMKDLNIQSYGISITTLEEVFLRVADQGIIDKNKKDENNQEKSNEQDNQNLNKQQSSYEDIDNFDLNSVRIQDGFSLFRTHIMAGALKRMLFFKRDTRGFVCEILLPCILVAFSLCLLLINFHFDSPALIINKSLFPQPLPTIYSGNEIANYATTNDMNQLLSYFDNSEFNLQYYQSTDIVDWDNKNFEQRNVNRKGSYYINKLQSNHLEYTATVQTNTKDIAPYLINRMNTALLRQLTNKKTSNIEISVHPFPLTENVKKSLAKGKALNAAFFFTLGFSFIPASIITYIVKERNDNIKHQQLVSGLSIGAYWLSNFLMDFIKHIIPSVFCILMVLAFQIEAYSGVNYGPVAILFFLYGWAIIPFTYLFSFIFKDHGNAQLASFFFHFILGSFGALAVFILRLIESTRDPGKILGWVLRIIPSFSFSYGILNIGAKKTYALFDHRKDIPDAYELDIAGGDILMLLIEGVVYLLLIFVIEKINHISSITRIFTNEQTVPFQNKPIDDDVSREEQKIIKSNPNEYAVHINQLRKVFIPEKGNLKVAVEKVSFGISNGECFTLLGVNGAGKTTTFKMLTGEINPTSGSAHIKGYNIQTQLKEARWHIGYCPQFDALLENLTAREHLLLYAVIKGIPQAMRNQLIEKKLIEMDLQKFENVPAGALSGGNKRKLSVAIAMLGNPPVVFLDEPSTGMDPKARRFMWNVISRISTKRKQSSIILTTHSMEEAEALSTTLAIQVDGRLQCYGSVQHIKSKFGEGYEVEIKLQVPSKEMIQQRIDQAQINQVEQVTQSFIQQILIKLNAEKFYEGISEDGIGSGLFQQLRQNQSIDLKTLVSFVIIEENGQEVMQFILNNLGNLELIEHFQTFFRFRIISKISIGKVFSVFEDNKKKLNIIQYSVKQPTIEQIFNMFAQGKIGAQLLQKKSVIKMKQFDENQQMEPQQDIKVNQLELEIHNNY